MLMRAAVSRYAWSYSRGVFWSQLTSISQYEPR